MFSLKGFSQKDRQLSLIGSYQVYNRQAVSFGAEYQKKADWAKVNFDSYLAGSLRGIFYFKDPELANEKIFGIQSSTYWSNKYFGVGVDGRLLFQDNRQRVDLGPAVKIGYKFFWLEYSANFLLGNNPFTNDNTLPVIEFNSMEHNLSIVLSIPILKIE
ncbi:hypothetical protein G3O08_17225 [Cryomorpha ignava]|uniref:Uncharacterized protein n=1 Tax=Cryomorpha ignava TaxID=101383 RepID=A0A7K3WW15_9FLAO|nr:hypothetical protein [Cryomorpha ignava]NEN25241.1 hypothetical protein [Cryomorpha ignava]